MSQYSYLEIFRRPLQTEELVRRVDVTGKKPDEKTESIANLYQCYPIDKYQIVLTGSDNVKECTESHVSPLKSQISHVKK
jgi:hypothetical protein